MRILWCFLAVLALHRAARAQRTFPRENRVGAVGPCAAFMFNPESAAQADGMIPSLFKVAQKWHVALS
jgi:hypothetical protein